MLCCTSNFPGALEARDARWGLALLLLSMTSNDVMVFLISGVLFGTAAMIMSSVT